MTYLPGLYVFMWGGGLEWDALINVFMSISIPYIVIADDDPEDAQMLAENFRLQNPGVEVACVDDGQQVLTLLIGQDVRQLPVMIVADYQMPQVSGAELFRLLQAQDKYRNITKVIWSTSCNKKHIEECLSHGADKYFVKPDEMAKLSSLVSDLTKIFKYAVIRAATDIDTGYLNNTFLQ